MASGGPSWLWLAFGSELSERDSFPAASSAQSAVEVLATGIDGAGWLAAAPFDTIMYGVLLHNGPSEPASFRIHRRELEIDTIPDARTMPADPSWWFLQQAQHVLDAVAERYDLGSPSLRALDDEPGPASLPADALPPVDRNAAADVSADLDALEDEQMLVVIPYQLPGEDEQASFERQMRADALLTHAFGPPVASGATGNAYVFTVAMARRRKRRW